MLSKPYKYNDKLFRYNFDTGEVQYISKADKEMLEDNEEWQVKYGRNLWDIDAEGYIILGTVGLHPDNWKNKAARDEYLSGWCIDLDAETQSLARDFERYELPGLLKQMEGKRMAEKMTKAAAKKLARELIIYQISMIGYGERYEEFLKKFDDMHDGEQILKAEMDRVAHLFGMKEAYFG